MYDLRRNRARTRRQGLVPAGPALGLQQIAC